MISKGGVLLTPYMYPPKMGYRPISAPTTDIPELDRPANVYSNPLYTQGFLAENVGRYIKVEFLIGTNFFIDREGVLKEVGISYIVLQQPETDDLLFCDIYSIKFVTIFY